MWYVANEVIQGCGKKRCPEFRTTFSKAIEKASSFENVKEIKKEVTRLLSFWKERNIYDEEFNQRIIENLNSTPLEDSSEDEEEELSEKEIIEHFKKENLVTELEKMKLFELKLKEKEDILNYANAPEMPDLDDMIVRQNCKKMLQKCDTYLALMTECSELVRKEIQLRKRLLKELKNNSIFYTAQQKDVKEVIKAFRIYGKRVKNMEEQLSEKILTLPSLDSPCFSDDNTNTPLSNVISPYDTDASNASKSSPGTFLSPTNKKSLSSNCGSNNLVQDFSSSEKTSKLAEKGLCERMVGVSQKITEDSTFPEFTKSNLDEALDLIKNTLSHQESVVGSQNVTFCEKTLNLEPEKIISQNEYFFVEEIGSHDKELKQSSSANALSTNDTKGYLGKKSAKSVAQTFRSKFEGFSDKGCSSLSATQTIVSDPTEQSQSKPTILSDQNTEDVDFMLEEAFDDKKHKGSINFKRKIDFLLQSKEKKTCSQLSEPNDKVSEKSDSSVSEQLEEISKSVTEKQKIGDEEKRDSMVKKPPTKVVPIANSHLSDLNIDITSVIGISNNLLSDEKSLSSNNVVGINDQTEPEKETMSFNFGGTFTGNALSSFMSGVSTDFLKNVLQKNHQESTDIKDDCVVNNSIVLPNPEPESFENLKPHIGLLSLEVDAPKEQNTAKHDNEKSNSNNVPESSLITNIKQEEQDSTNYMPLGNLASQIRTQSSVNVEQLERTFIPSTKQPIHSDVSSTSESDQIINKKSNLLESLQNVLEHLSEKMSTGRDITTCSLKENSAIDPPLSLESCLKIYEFVHNSSMTFKNESSINCPEIDSSFSKDDMASVIPSSDDNYEVMDMECDSEEDD